MRSGRRARVRIGAKINPYLAIGPRRADGYHELCSVMQSVDLTDELTAELASPTEHPAGSSLMGLRLQHDGAAGVPDGDDNLALRAARALLAELGGRVAPAGPRVPTTTLTLRKRIPVAAGMAGGSADAAAALLACARVWQADVGRSRLAALAASLGADVPFCLEGGTAVATGTGTDLAPTLTGPRMWWVVGVAAAPLSTREVYAAHDRLGADDRRPHEPTPVLRALRAGDPRGLAGVLRNDLQPAAVSLRPGLAEDLHALRDAGALAAVVSGSGPTALGLVADHDDGERVARAVADRFVQVEVVAAPAGGPRVTLR